MIRQILSGFICNYCCHGPSGFWCRCIRPTINTDCSKRYMLFFGILIPLLFLWTNPTVWMLSLVRNFPFLVQGVPDLFYIFELAYNGSQMCFTYEDKASLSSKRLIIWNETLSDVNWPLFYWQNQNNREKLIFVTFFAIFYKLLSLLANQRFYLRNQIFKAFWHARAML